MEGISRCSQLWEKGVALRCYLDKWERAVSYTHLTVFGSVERKTVKTEGGEQQVVSSAPMLKQLSLIHICPMIEMIFGALYFKRFLNAVLI